MASYLGIDLGTTFSAAAYIDESGRPKIITLDKENIIPSCVAMIKDQIVVGERARRQWGNDPDTAAARFKRDMGGKAEYSIGGSPYTPTDLSSMVLKRIKELAEVSIGEIGEVVVTIPANFAQEARDSTMLAARNSGLNVKYIINEPTAAALYYAYTSDDGLTGTYAVFDLGGGTFDISIIKVNGNDVDVVASNGLSKLGGDDFDRALLKLVQEKYEEETEQQMDLEDFPINDAEEEKKSLSRRKRSTVEIDGDLIDISRSEFEEIISSYLSQIEMMCEATIDEAGIGPSDIDKVFLAGGSTRIPAIHELIERVFESEPISEHNVDEVVALGAALYAAYKSDGEHLTALQKQSVSKITVTETSNMCFGTISVSYSEATGTDVLENSILIYKGETLPCSVTHSYYTRHKGQDAINCKITESKSAESNPKFVKVIWEGTLELPKNREAEKEIQVTYSYDENQLMSASFKDVESGHETNIEISLAKQKDEQSPISKFLVD